MSGLDKYINRYTVNEFGHSCMNDAPPADTGVGTGLYGYYFRNIELKGTPNIVQDSAINFDWNDQSPFNYDFHGFRNRTDPSFPKDFTIRWLGRLKAPVSGTYTFGFRMDDGFRFWLDDTLLVDDWHMHRDIWDTKQVTLVAGKMYNVRAEFLDGAQKAFIRWMWRRPDYTGTDAFDHDSPDFVTKKYLFPPVFSDTVPVNQFLTQEDRVNSFRKANHISEIDVLNPDGRKYVYGIPVYNLVQKESSFNVEKGRGTYSQE
ncbi:PA14 domain-containing protein [Puia sp. P3]|uniref:PA14 domain-containing protein n=1 Tax=Puia sp. P3 TaxID=3423952 RepID=UPI003D66A846